MLTIISAAASSVLNNIIITLLHYYSIAFLNKKNCNLVIMGLVNGKKCSEEDPPSGNAELQMWNKIVNNGGNQTLEFKIFPEYPQKAVIKLPNFQNRYCETKDIQLIEVSSGNVITPSWVCLLFYLFLIHLIK